MPRTKSKPREPREIVTKKVFTPEEVSAIIFSYPKPLEWKKGQFVFNTASKLYGDNFVRSVGYNPYYEDENIKPFINALTEALNKRN
jgi:hypothetical protein